MRISRRPEPFDSDEYVYELKIDGFRALAHIAEGIGELISRNGNVFRGFKDLATWLAEHLKVEDAVLVCKRKSSPYHVTEKPSPYWIKVKNPRYSQAEGREELFDRNG